MNRPGKRKWSLWRAALLGLAITFGVFLINLLAEGTEQLTPWLNARPSEMIAYFAGRLLWLPTLLVLIAFVRNLFIKEGATA